MKLMLLRYAGNCTSCGVRIEQRVQGWYDANTKTVTCTSCRPVSAQLGVDVGPAVADVPALPVPPLTPTRSDRSDLQKGTELEQQIAGVFAAAGYRVQTNVIREGKSGGRHEIDVLAEKTDELITLSVAIECKAWANAIDKDVVIKVDHVRRDLGIGHAVVVALNGARSGAHAAAAELGITVWTDDEIQRHLGRTVVSGLQNRPMVEEVGFARKLDTAAAAALVTKETSGGLFGGKEELVWSSDAWLPVAVVQLTLMTTEGLVRKQTRTTHAWAIYDLVTGAWINRVDAAPERKPVQLDAGQVAPKLKLGEPARTLEAVVAKYRKVTSDDARIKYRGQMRTLGIPDHHTAAADRSEPFLYPVHLAIARQRGTERVIAVDANVSRVDNQLSTALTREISRIRESLGA